MENITMKEEITPYYLVSCITKVVHAFLLQTGYLNSSNLLDYSVIHKDISFVCSISFQNDMLLELSSSDETDNMESQQSEDSVCGISRTELFNKFLSISGMSPVKTLKVPLVEASLRTQRRYIQKAKKCVDIMLETISPGDVEFMKKKMLLKSEDNDTSLEVLFEIYKEADSWTTQRQILSIIVQHHDYEDVKKVCVFVKFCDFNQFKMLWQNKKLLIMLTFHAFATVYAIIIRAFIEILNIFCYFF